MGFRPHIRIIMYLVVGLLIISVGVSAEEAPKCDYCGKLIDGQYISSGSKNYHKDCFENNITLRCALCGEIIDEGCYKDYWGNLIHAEHVGKVPQCEYCQRLISEKITNGGVEYDDGRMVCNICVRTAISDAVTAEAIKSTLQNILGLYGIATSDQDIPLFLVNKNTMTELSSGFHADPLGFVYYERTDYVDKGVSEKSYKVYILTGIPRYQFIGALAHELIHIWIFANGPSDLDAALQEGSCNYAAYLVLQKFDEEEAKFVTDNMLSNPTPTYGEGFRRVKDFVGRYGISRWLEYLVNNKQLPR